MSTTSTSTSMTPTAAATRVFLPRLRRGSGWAASVGLPGVEMVTAGEKETTERETDRGVQGVPGERRQALGSQVCWGASEGERDPHAHALIRLPSSVRAWLAKLAHWIRWAGRKALSHRSHIRSISVTRIRSLTHACMQTLSHTLPKSRSHCLVDRVALGNEENEGWQRQQRGREDEVSECVHGSEGQLEREKEREADIEERQGMFAEAFSQSEGFILSKAPPPPPPPPNTHTLSSSPLPLCVTAIQPEERKKSNQEERRGWHREM